MRVAKANDYWRKVFRREYDHSIETVNLNGVGGINEVDFAKGIFAICGLNGAGKSTIISSLKDILGLKINNQDLKRIKGSNVMAQVISKGQELQVSNNDNDRFVDVSDDRNSIYYLDYKQSTDALDFLEQENLDELLEQFESNILTTDLIEDLNYIVGKAYDAVTLIEIEDGEELIPYFKVKTNTLEYDSLSMGIGEHFLFYIFWVFYRIEGSGIILIEEPETFISINSQKKLMNFMAKKVSNLGITVIMATHSPYIIQNIEKENIRIISRYSEHVSIIKPVIIRESLVSLGLEAPKKGCIFVEDTVAEIFLQTLISKNCDHILRDYNIENVEGHAAITERLKFPNSNKFTYEIIGIYDGDVRDEVEKVKNKINWEYGFLPTKDAIEIDFKNCVKIKVKQFAESIQIDIHKMIHILSKIDGEDHHDWLIELSRNLGKDISLLIEKLYDIWYEDEESQTAVREFLQEFEKLCYK
ncbi:AAA family ATPase [Bacillus cereus]|nr:AAA family ATPase [Bacillus cereus]